LQYSKGGAGEEKLLLGGEPAQTKGLPAGVGEELRKAETTLSSYSFSMGGGGKDPTQVTRDCSCRRAEGLKLGNRKYNECPLTEKAENDIRHRTEKNAESVSSAGGKARRSSEKNKSS